MLIHGLLAASFFVWDVNSPYGDPRERQNPSIGVHAMTSIASKRLPDLSLRFDAPFRLIGNVNGGFPHAPADAQWGIFLRYEKPSWYLQAGHYSWHRLIPQVFDTRQLTGAEVGFTY